MKLLHPLLDPPPHAPRLSIELVPQSQWGANLSKTLAGERWDHLRRSTYKAAGHRCQVCDGKGPKWPVEAHEEWEYDDAAGVQRLVALVALCPSCHEVKHFGRANRLGRGDAALRHLIRVNRWSQDCALQYIAGAFATWEQRSARAWGLDLSILGQYGVQPPSEQELAASISAAASAYGPAEQPQANPGDAPDPREEMERRVEEQAHQAPWDHSGRVRIREISTEVALELLRGGEYG